MNTDLCLKKQNWLNGIKLLFGFSVVIGVSSCKCFYRPALSTITVTQCGLFFNGIHLFVTLV